MRKNLQKYFSEIGRRGGQRSRRRLSPQQARNMVRVREARRAYRRYHAQCFWSSPPDLVIGVDDVAWVAGQLMRHGGLAAWRKGAALLEEAVPCR